MGCSLEGTTTDRLAVRTWLTVHATRFIRLSRLPRQIVETDATSLFQPAIALGHRGPLSWSSSGAVTPMWPILAVVTEVRDISEVDRWHVVRV